MERPWWLLVFLLPLCCGSTFLAFLLGAGGAGLMGGLIAGVSTSPWGALGLGGAMGVLFAVPLLVVADRRSGKVEGCAVRRGW